MDINTLPNDTKSLKSLLIEHVESSNKKIGELEAELNENKFKIILLEDEVNLLRLKKFGISSERWIKKDNDQKYLFDEIENTVSDFVEESDEIKDDKEEDSEITVKSYTRQRKKTGRQKLPEHLPCEIIVHDLSDEQLEKYKDGVLTKIGVDVSERLRIKPAEFYKEIHERNKYSFKPNGSSETEIVIAPVFNQIIPKSIATPSLLSYLCVSKFTDHLPFYRIERIFKNRLGISLSRATMCNWMMDLKDRFSSDFITSLKKHLLKSPVINIDETTVKVLDDPRRSKNGKNYMWVYRGELPDKKAVILFQYGPGRSGEIPHDFLNGYEGYIQTDGYGGYEKLCNSSKKITHLFCWAHVRRKFHDVLTASSGSEHAKKALDIIQKLFEIEDNARKNNIPDNRFLAIRLREAVPLISDFKSLLDYLVDKTPPKSLLGKAVNYALNLWDGLTRYPHKSFLRPDNNLAENAIRPFCVGRKNWLFSGNSDGAEASAFLYSLIETCRVNNIEPYYFFEWLFTRLEKNDFSSYEDLLPWNFPGIRP